LRLTDAVVDRRTGCGDRRFTCPYHGWVHDTTGELVGVPENMDRKIQTAPRSAAG